MNLFFHVFVSVLGVFVLFTYYFWTKDVISDSVLFVIGILSARQNFDLREQARSSWLKNYSPQENHSVKAWFIVGKEDCKIPPSYRLSPYECQKWDINKTGLTEYFYASKVVNEACDAKKEFKQGFSFRVNHPVVVKKLGVLFYLLAENSETKVAILDPQLKSIDYDEKDANIKFMHPNGPSTSFCWPNNDYCNVSFNHILCSIELITATGRPYALSKESTETINPKQTVIEVLAQLKYLIPSAKILVQTTITQNSSSLENGYLYEDIEAILLPKHYEGMVLVEGYLQRQACVNALWNDGGGVITFNRIYSTPSHLDSIKFRNDIYSAASIQFYVHDLENLNKLISKEENITIEWLSGLENINENLLKENMKTQDILFVDVLDTYRNLPLKLLQFYRWVHSNYEFAFLMKTDDDTVIQVEKLIDHTKSHSVFDPDELWIWSWFRKAWPVNYIGKWAEFDYTSSLYPAFPCGALYILSRKTVRWLSLNAELLFPYQGEDVSIGIWLSAIKANFIENENFHCDSTCNKRSYNRAQLTASQISEVWSIYETCQNLCSCD